MFEGWQRADIISAAAMMISGLAFGASILAVWYTRVQAKIAQRKATEEDAAKEPAIEPTVKACIWPDWYRIGLRIRNRQDIAIDCEALRVLKPRAARVVFVKVAAGGKRQQNGFYVLPKDPPMSMAKRTLMLDLQLQGAGAGYSVFERFVGTDSDHLEILAFVPGAASSIKRIDLRMSVSVRLSNESDAFADSIVVVKIPTVTTNSET